MEGHKLEVISLFASGTAQWAFLNVYHSVLGRPMKLAFRLAGYNSLSQLDEVTPAFMTKILREAGALEDDVDVESVLPEPFGGGAMGVTCRLHIEYSRASALGPKSLVWKAANQSTSEELKSYSFAPVLDREVAVYAKLGPLLPETMPRLYYAYANGRLAESAMILEDLRGARGGKFNAANTVADSMNVMRAAGKLQRESWGKFPADEPLFKGPLAAMYLHADHWKAMVDGKTPRWDDYGRRYKESEAANRLAQLTSQPKYFELMMSKLFDSKWLGLCHGDLRLDNIFFAKDGAILIDFQTVERCAIGRDLAWHLLYELEPAERRRHDKALIRAAYEELVKGGHVTGITYEDVWESYMYGLVFGFCFAVMLQNLLAWPDHMHEMMLVCVPRVMKSLEDYDLATWLEKQLQA